MFSSKFNESKCKANLKMLNTRFQLIATKKTNLLKQQKREVAMLLRDNKEAQARILVEHIIREDYTLESYELLRQHADLLGARLNILAAEPDLRPEIAVAVSSLVYAGWLMAVDIPELGTLHKIFVAKYGKKIVQQIVDNKDQYLEARLIHILTRCPYPRRS